WTGARLYAAGRPERGNALGNPAPREPLFPEFSRATRLEPPRGPGHRAGGNRPPARDADSQGHGSEGRDSEQRQMSWLPLQTVAQISVERILNALPEGFLIALFAWALLRVLRGQNS